MEEAGDKLHIVVFPWLALGHMLPFLELSKSLARRGHLVSYVTTPKNLQRLPKVPPEISPQIQFVPLPLPRVDGISDTAEATTDVPPKDIQYLKNAIDGLEKPFVSFISSASPKPHWIIQDFVQHWIPKAAAEAGVRCAYFCTIPAACLTFYGPPSELESRRDLEQYTVQPPWVPFPSNVAYRRHEIFRMAADYHNNNSDVSDAHRLMTTTGCSDVLVIRSCWELEREWLSLLRKVYNNKPVIPIGLLPPLVMERSEDNESEIVDWLDKQRAKSVVYVALGTEVALEKELLRELARGLELAELPFLWGLRRPFGCSDDAEFLPEGFEERTERFGKVVMGWVPQLKVLAHQSVGGFLTHCGWSSIIEGIQCGHPLVMLPIFGDQGLNARLMGDKGLGVEVERNDDDGSFTRVEVEKALKLIMVDEEGDAYREKAQEMKAMFSEEDQEKYLDDFVHYLFNHRTA